MVLYYVVPISYIVPGYLTPVTVYCVACVCYIVHNLHHIGAHYDVLDVTFNLVITVFYGIKEKTSLKMYNVQIYDV